MKTTPLLLPLMPREPALDMKPTTFGSCFTIAATAVGEEAQEAWLRMNSVAWLNVQVNGQTPGGLTGADIGVAQSKQCRDHGLLS